MRFYQILNRLFSTVTKVRIVIQLKTNIVYKLRVHSPKQSQKAIIKYGQPIIKQTTIDHQQLKPLWNPFTKHSRPITTYFRLRAMCIIVPASLNRLPDHPLSAHPFRHLLHK